MQNSGSHFKWSFSGHTFLHHLCSFPNLQLWLSSSSSSTSDFLQVPIPHPEFIDDTLLLQTHLVEVCGHNILTQINTTFQTSKSKTGVTWLLTSIPTHLLVDLKTAPKADHPPSAFTVNNTLQKHLFFVKHYLQNITSLRNFWSLWVNTNFPVCYLKPQFINWSHLISPTCCLLAPDNIFLLQWGVSSPQLHNSHSCLRPSPMSFPLKYPALNIALLLSHRSILFFVKI